MRTCWRVWPQACARDPQLHFVIGGEGSHAAQLDAMRRAEGIEARVEMVGAVSGPDVPRFLAQGHIFLNCSLTESFCIAVLEAAS